MNDVFTKIYLPYIMVFFVSSVSFGQYGNEWINQGQTYCKKKVGSTGIGLEVLVQNLPKHSLGIHLLLGSW